MAIDKADIIKANARGAADTGSPEVQVALPVHQNSPFAVVMRIA